MKKSKIPCGVVLLYLVFIFQVYVNDKYFTEFNHRTGLNDVSHFHVQGNMDIKDVEYLEPLVSCVSFTNLLVPSSSHGQIFHINAFMLVRYGKHWMRLCCLP